jgi:hypothetical protein
LWHCHKLLAQAPSEASLAPYWWHQWLPAIKKGDILPLDFCL